MQTMRQVPVLSDPPTDPFVSVTQHDGRPRFCEHCQRIKPDRAHHCRECDSCTLKMDQYVIYLFIFYFFIPQSHIMLTNCPPF
jgi:ribosomal protein L40E